MPWIIDEIRREWLNGDDPGLPANDVTRAFETAEEVRGRDWVLGTTQGIGGFRISGFGSFLRPYWLGTRVDAVHDAMGLEAILDRVRQDDFAAESELTAAYMLRLRNPDAELEFGPEIDTGRGVRVPDFRIRVPSGDWTYVEVTRLNASNASTRVATLLQRVAHQIAALPKAFILEIILWRDLSDDEEAMIVDEARSAVEGTFDTRRDVSDVASILVKSGDPSAIVSDSSMNTQGPSAVVATTVIGPAGESRQVLVRTPFADERAENVLTVESRQLPKNGNGLIMVDISGQPSALASWPALVARRFTPTQHTRVSGVILFQWVTTANAAGLVWVPQVRLLANAHASSPLRPWIGRSINEARAETLRVTGFLD
jgi:hypothetical protein